MSTIGRAARHTLLVAGGILPWPAATLTAQQGTTSLVGSVRDSAGRGLAGVEVRIGEGALAALTNEAGGFRIAVVPVGPMTVHVRRLGFAPAATSVTLRAGRIDSLVVSLTVVAASLPGVVVEDEADTRSKRMLAGFWERRSRGFGSFLTRADIEARRTSEFVDLVRRMPSANVAMINGRSTIRFKRSMSSGFDCPPQYWVDGMRLESASPEEFIPEDVEALEVYPGPATLPAQFAPRPNSYTCGAIIIWTRLPGV
jgi:hypothetical protein